MLYLGNVHLQSKQQIQKIIQFISHITGSVLGLCTDGHTTESYLSQELLLAL
jgi:hypothetical protein